MDKNKIMDLVGELSIYASNADNYYKIEDLTEQIEDELNSKPVMPKVFDEWYKSAIKTEKEYPHEEMSLYTGLANIYLDSSWVDESSYDLAGWIDSDDKYLMCIDAIRYGYEVAK